ncbi:hypothetical protein CVT24_007790 [Panaeolus cyanescens]|uniref:Aerobactin siderophore biosynthesis IucA/IucC N-terminal domain-containing protein n=1 Tax=Panaeolus cyanescens TaxID=181874 RepID=A0A409YKQ6_9AGAR|nr:hypothetical protein CVT24_007790 [Panaeolus cyanescens]
MLPQSFPKDLSPQALNRAKFATTARLLSCLVTESLVQAFYRPIQWKGVSGVALVLSGDPSPKDSKISSESILAVVPLHHPPVLKDETPLTLGARIGLLDPLDMLGIVFQTTERIPEPMDEKHSKLIEAIWGDLQIFLGGPTEKPLLCSSTDVLTIWHQFASSTGLGEDIENDIAGEFTSAIAWQAYSYDHPPAAPLFTSPSIDWEQSIVEGHPTHPMHKTRRFLPPLPDYSPGSYDLLQPTLRFVSVPRDNLKVTYDFEQLTVPLLKAAANRAGEPFTDYPNHVVVPVHELQVAHIEDKFPDAIVIPPNFSLPLLAQQSLRSVIVPDVYRDLHLKLGVGVKLTSAVRTISPESAYFGPRFSMQVVPALTMDRNIVTVARELASVVHVNPQGEVAKHCAAIVRECFELTSEEKGERLIVCTSLVERGHRGTDGTTPSVIRVFELDTQDKRIEWLEKFISVFLKAFLPPMLHNGVAFECHPQNCVARFDLQTKEIKGFIIRDFGGLKVHRQTLKETTGVDLDVVDGHSVIASTLNDVYTRMYHTIIHNHFQQLIRILDLHYNGLGWDVVRRQLREQIPSDHPLYALWLSEDVKTFPGKCFMRMRMSSMYRFVSFFRLPSEYLAYSLSAPSWPIPEPDSLQGIITLMLPTDRSTRDRAGFAVISRLVSCLVTERILPAVYIPFRHPVQSAVGFAVVILTHSNIDTNDYTGVIQLDSIFAVVPLRNVPVLQSGSRGKYGYTIGLLDPLDMHPQIYCPQKAEVDSEKQDPYWPCIAEHLSGDTWCIENLNAVISSNDPVYMWLKFANWASTKQALREAIKIEIQSSWDWQTLSYENPPKCPSLSSTAIEWEQSLVAGHPTHPMHRARMLPSASMDYDWYHPRIRFAKVPKGDVSIQGDFESVAQSLLIKAVSRAKAQQPDMDGFLAMPAHELQVENIKTKFPNVEILDPEIFLPASAQSSIRTVTVPDAPGIALKLALGVRISSALRTISHFTADFGPRFSADVVPKLAVDPAILHVEREPSSAVYSTPDAELSKHLTAVIREEYQPPSGEVVIVVAALLEYDHSDSAPGVSAVQEAFQLYTREKRIKFLDRYIRIACFALIPALIRNGVAFEAHAQNVLVRVDVASKEVRGFVIRDLGGLRIHPPTLRASTKTDFQFLPEHCVATKTLEEIYPKFYHTFVHNHIQRLIRLLDLHTDGSGWDILRKHMNSVIPRNHPVWKVWMDPCALTVDSKCLLRMRMKDSYRDMIYSPYPNMIQYRPVVLEEDQKDEELTMKKWAWSRCIIS